VGRFFGIYCAILLALLLHGVTPVQAQLRAAESSSGTVRAVLSSWSVAPTANSAPRKPERRDVVLAIRDAADHTGMDFAYLLAQAHLESSLDPDAPARSSSARGLYQFIESTWLASLDRNADRYNLASGLRRKPGRGGKDARPSRAALLALRNDPAISAMLAAADALDHTRQLQGVLGRTPSGTELYLAHFLGSGGAARFLTAWKRAPETNAADAFPRQARANQAIFYGPEGTARSLGDVLLALDAKFKEGLQATAKLHELTRNSQAPLTTFIAFKQIPEKISSLEIELTNTPNTCIVNLERKTTLFSGIRDHISNDVDIENRTTDLSGVGPISAATTAPRHACNHIEMWYSNNMSTSIITRVRELVSSGKMTRTGLARAAGLHANTLRDATEPDWNPTADTLQKLEMFLDFNDERPVLATIDEIIDEARNGRMYILVDDEDRENEGDLIIPAQMATPQAINFMATHGRGLICLALTKERVDHLGLTPMSRNNKESMQTAFTISIEAREGVTTGISAADRARTISVAIDATKGADDLVTPGHVFPLMARDGGTLVRAGHTEAAVDISRLAGLNPSGVICEIMNEDGTMARLDDLITFARRHDMKIGTIRDLIAYRMRNDHLVERLSERAFNSDYGGQWRMITYRDRVAGSEAYVLQKGHVIPGEPTLARVHPISVFDDVLGQPGPRKRTLQRAMQAIGEHGSGVIVILTGRVGAGEWQPGEEQRNIGIGSQILADLGVAEMVLLSNSRPDLVALEGYGLTITDFHPIPE
jgi:3,4-dihydroxy 2-butanone 4-phosphate synthase/GTP cyclohydrolase II